MKLTDYVYLAIIAFLLFFLGREMVNHRNDSKRDAATIVAQGAYIDSLENAKQKITIDTIEVIKYVNRYIVKPQAIDSVEVFNIMNGRMGYMPTPLDSVIYRKYYEYTLNTEDFELPYSVSVFGDLESVNFSEYKIKKEVKTIENIVKVPVDVVREINKSHLYLQGSFGTALEIDEYYLWGVGLNMTLKNKMSVGVGYLKYGKTNFVTGSLGIKIL